MARPWRRWPTLLAASAGAVVAFVADSAAAEREEPILFEYVSPPECPGTEHVLEQVRSYTTRWTLAPAGTEARRFVLRITRDGTSYVGQLDLTSASGPGVGRDIRGESCEDVAAGLAVVVALAIDPTSSGAPSPPPEPVVGEPAVSEERKTVRTPPTARHPPESTPSVSRAAISAGARVDAVGAVSGVLVTMAALAEIAWSRPIDRLPSVNPVLRAGYKQSLPRTAHVGESSADMVWRAGFVEACPSRFALPAHLFVEGCVGLNIGQLSAEAQNVRDGQPRGRFWLDYGALIGVRWQLHPHAFVELSGGVWFPMTRESFRIEPDGVVSMAPALGGSFGAGGGWRF